MSEDAKNPLDEHNAAEIKRNGATEHGARGNVHSEADQSTAEQEAPPSLPH
ncbi:MAG: hypothetical protein ACRYFW_02875 [Janthinobacterium lividum]